MPLRAPELVESQHVDVFDGPVEALADPGHVLDVLLQVGQPWHEHEPHPDLLAGLRQPPSEVDGGLQQPPGDLVVGLLVARLDVEQAQVDVVDHLVGVVGVEEAGRVEAGVHAHLLGRVEHARDERRLHHRLAAGERDAAMRGLEQVLVPVNLLDHGVEVYGLPVAHLPRVGVLAVLAAQGASGHEDGHARARAIDRRVDVPRVDEADVAAFERVDAVAPIEADGRFEAGKPSHQGLRGVFLRRFEHMRPCGAELRDIRHHRPP